MASFSVVSNIASANAQANLLATNIGLNKALTPAVERLPHQQSGDDAAGLAVANQLSRRRGDLNQGIRNANDGLSKLQIKDGALNNISTLLDRLATLATQAASVDQQRRRRHQAVGRIQPGSSAEIDREADGRRPAGDRRRFSVFVRRSDGRPTAWSSDGSVGGRGRQRTSASRPDHLRPNATEAQTALATSHGGDRHPRRRAEPRSARCRTACSSPSAWRSRSWSTRRPPRAASATRTSRRNRRT